MKSLVFCFFRQYFLLPSKLFCHQVGVQSGKWILSYSVGKINDQTYTGIEGTVSEGVQQPYEISVIEVVESETIQMNISVFPNLTTNILNLKIENKDLSELNLKLFDLNGKQIEEKKISSSETQLNFSGLNSSTYYLRIYQGKHQVKVFKIIKNQ